MIRNSGRNTDGTFGPGNPGKPKGARHRATQAALALLDAEAEALTRKDDEPEAEFQRRAEMLSGDAEARNAWAMAALRRKHATSDPA
ncbi:MAG: hypothetical protein ACT4N9_02660 [Paracoccaceae bacterium]